MTEERRPEMSSILAGQLDEIFGRKDPLAPRREEIRRWGDRFIRVSGDVIRDIPQFKIAAVESRLPQDIVREKDNGVWFPVGNLHVHVNYYLDRPTNDRPKRTRRMLLEISSEEILRTLTVSTYVGQTEDPDERIHYTKLDGKDITDELHGLSAMHEGYNMLKALRAKSLRSLPY